MSNNLHGRPDLHNRRKYNNKFKLYGPYLGNSDHINLSMDLNISVTRVPNRTIYSYDKADYEKMKTMLNIDWKNSTSEYEYTRCNGQT